MEKNADHLVTKVNDVVSESDTVTFTNTKFGSIAVEKTSILCFPDGVPGFEHFKEYGLVSIDEEAPFLRLLSIDEPSLGFVILNPATIWPDYDPQISGDELKSLNVENSADLEMYCVVTLSSSPQEVTANLKGPIVINASKMIGRQLILSDERYSTKHFLLNANAQTVESE